MKITIDKDQFSSDEDDFPVTVFINSSAGQSNQDLTAIFDEVGANYLKIAVTDDDDNQLYVEVDEWWDGSEEAFLHVKVPECLTASDVDIYIYYDSTKADNTSYVGIVDSTPAENVWDSSFAMVQHMSDITTSTIKDSTTNDNDGTKQDTNGPIESGSGIIGNCQDFDGNDDYIASPDSSSLDITGALTLELWLKTAALVGDDGGLLSKSLDVQKYFASTARKVYEMGILNNAIYLQLGNGSSQSNANGDASGLIDDAWHHVASSWDGTTSADMMKIFFDGVDTYQGTCGFASLQSVDSVFDIGGYDQLWSYDGLIDEVRVSNTNRSAAWLKGTREAGVDNLLLFGSEEEYSPPSGAMQLINGGLVNSGLIDGGLVS